MLNAEDIQVTETPVSLAYATPRPRWCVPVFVPVIAFAIAQFVLTIATFVVAMRFHIDDIDDPATPFEDFCDYAFAVLSFPFFRLCVKLQISGVSGWVIIAVNSLLWGLVATFLIRAIGLLFRARKSPECGTPRPSST
jgi:hypothetical protein